MKNVIKVQEEMLSLYDFLGKAAGSDLGKEVYAAAKEQKQLVETKEVRNPKYTGIILMYPKSFLMSFFKGRIV